MRSGIQMRKAHGKRLVVREQKDSSRNPTGSRCR